MDKVPRTVFPIMSTLHLKKTLSGTVAKIRGKKYLGLLHVVDQPLWDELLELRRKVGPGLDPIGVVQNFRHLLEAVHVIQQRAQILDLYLLSSRPRLEQAFVTVG